MTTVHLVDKIWEEKKTVLHPQLATCCFVKSLLAFYQQLANSLDSRCLLLLGTWAACKYNCLLCFSPNTRRLGPQFFFSTKDVNPMIANCVGHMQEANSVRVRLVFQSWVGADPSFLPSICSTGAGFRVHDFVQQCGTPLPLVNPAMMMMMMMMMKKNEWVQLCCRFTNFLINIIFLFLSTSSVATVYLLLRFLILWSDLDAHNSMA